MHPIVVTLGPISEFATILGVAAGIAIWIAGWLVRGRGGSLSARATSVALVVLVASIALRRWPLTIHSYGLMMAISFGIGIWLAIRLGAARGLSAEQITDLALVILVASIVGARILFVVPHWDDFRDDPLSVFWVWEGGLTFFGGVILAVVAAAVFVKKAGLDWWRVADSTAPPLALGIGIARIGCFLNGCCHGHPATGLFCVTFPPDAASTRLFGATPVLATQLIESVFGFALFGVLVLVNRSRPRDGTLILIAAMGYGAFRFFLDFVRYYESSMQIPLGAAGVISVNQLVSLGLVALCGVALARRGVRGSRGDRQEPGVIRT
ncbi:MAG: prolipoprotein diacylglyceryl transferase [bacterium]